MTATKRATDTLIMLIVLLVRQARTPMPKMEWSEVTRVSPA